MKIKTLALIGLLSCAALPSVHAAGFFFGISDGHRGHHPRPRHHVYHRPIHRPIVIRERLVPVRVSCEIPYGDMRHGLVVSPWSDFAMSVGGRVSGEVVYDPNTGKAFRIP